MLLAIETIPVLKKWTSLEQSSGIGSGFGKTPPNISNSSWDSVQEWYALVGALPVTFKIDMTYD